MFELIWTVVCLIIFVGIVITEPDFFSLVVFGFCLFSGIYLLVLKIKKNIGDKNTDVKGEECFGIVKSVIPTDNYVNGEPIYEALVAFYITSLDQKEELSEVIGLDYLKYEVGSYVKLKYYNGDINILGIVDFFDIPKDVRKCLKVEEKDLEYIDDVINVDGVYYKRFRYNLKDKNNLSPNDIIFVNGIKYKKM